MFTTRIRIAAALAASALILSGCGLGGGGGQSEALSASDRTGAGSLDEVDRTQQINAVTDGQLQGATISMARFFGDCEDTTQGVTDMAKAGTECEAIQILTNKFVAENKWGIQVERLGGATWHSYYDSLNAALASPDKPDIAVMHGSNLPNYAARNQLVAIDRSFGVDLADATQPALEAVKWEGSAYAVPFDTHAIISHLNLDLLKQAGLLNAEGKYEMPTSVEGFLADAKTFKEKTGKIFIDIAMANDPMASRLWMASVWQQGTDFIDRETNTVDAQSEAAKASLNLLTSLVEGGYTNPTHDYDASQQSFLRGEAGIMYNGVWAVNQYTAEAPFTYGVTDAPMLFDRPATWANSHIWAIPIQEDEDPVKYRAAIEFATFLYENSAAWAVATGHMASSNSALESPEYQAAPHRVDYIKTATSYGHMQPRLVQWPAVGDLVQESIETTWLNNASVDDALATLQSNIEGALK